LGRRRGKRTINPEMGKVVGKVGIIDRIDHF
jgi:hypothetical protein